MNYQARFFEYLSRDMVEHTVPYRPEVWTTYFTSYSFIGKIESIHLAKVGKFVNQYFVVFYGDVVLEMSVYIYIVVFIWLQFVSV